MNQRSIRAEGHLYLREGVGEGEGLARTSAAIEPLTFILSPSQGERREKAGILLLQT
jgi:hypothetical protein